MKGKPIIKVKKSINITSQVDYSFIKYPLLQGKLKEFNNINLISWIKRIIFFEGTFIFLLPIINYVLELKSIFPELSYSKLDEIDV